MSYNFLDKDGLTYFWNKIKTIFAKKSEIPTKTSQLTNDSHLNYSIEKPSGTIDDLAAFTSGKPGITGSISLTKKASGIGSEIPAGWYNFYFSPHRTGSSGDNMNYGTIILTPMTFSGASWILRRTANATTITEVKKIAVSTDIPTKTSQLTNDSSYIRNYSYYINTHPENSPVLIPFVNNDIAFLLKRGGSVNIYYDGVEKSIDISNAFDGSPSYGLAINPTGITEIVIVLNLHKTFTWNNTIYSDFGSAGWRAKDVKIEVINTNYAQDVWTEKYHNTNNGSGNVFVTTAHTPVGASNQGGGFNKVRFTFKTWATATIFRISQLGIYNYGSYGSRETSMSRGIDDYVFRNITPNSNNTYNLGSSSNKWANVYATTFQGNATSATKATGDKNGNDIATTYQTKLTAQTAYSAKGSATKVPKITTNSLGQVTNITEVDIDAGSGTIGSSNDTIENIVSLTKAEYDALQTKETKTLYNITDDTSGGGFNVDDVYPVGSIYMSVNSTNPSNLFGGTWTSIPGRFLIGAGQGYTAGDTGGSTTNTIAKENLPNYNLYSTSHNHGGVYNGTTSSAGLKRDGDAVNKGQVILNTSTKNTGDKTITVSSGGSGTALNNMPPYLVVYIWKRVS